MTIEQLIEPYIDGKALRTMLHNKKYDAVSDLVEEAMRTIAQYNPRHEHVRYFHALLLYLRHDVMNQVLMDDGLDFGADYEDNCRMKEDFAAFVEQKPLSSGVWLYDAKSEKPVKNQKLKERFFLIMKSLWLDFREFDVVPPDSPVPKIQRKSYGDFEMATVAEMDMTDDAGFGADLNPIGKSYVMTDADGCVYHLDNVRSSAVPGNMDTEGGRQYAADGYIEGYTSPEPREIEFEVFGKRGAYEYVFSYSTEGTKDADYAHDSRWDMYLIWETAALMARKKYIDTLIEHAL